MYTNMVSAKPAPVCDRIGTEAMLSLFEVDKYVAQDVSHENHNLHKR